MLSEQGRGIQVHRACHVDDARVSLFPRKILSLRTFRRPSTTVYYGRETNVTRHHYCCGEWFLHNRRVQAFGLEHRKRLVPTGSIGKGAMHEQNILYGIR
jgi:hypothetical protein